MTKRNLALRGDPRAIFELLNSDPDNRNSHMHAVGRIVVSLLMTGEEPTFRDRVIMEMVGIEIIGVVEDEPEKESTVND